MRWLALDIGGANIKLADGRGFTLYRPFAMWKRHLELAAELRSLIAESPPSDHLAVTMTGELADCFANRAEGVDYILNALTDAADGRHTRVFLTNGTLVTPAFAARNWELAAASNWLALAQFSGRFVKHGPAILIDLGSTTCDLVPLRDGIAVPQERTDLQRLLAGELLYTGVERSPICGVLGHIRYRGRPCPVAQEVFATTVDAYLCLGEIPEDCANVNTADQRPQTKFHARTRLGRMLGADGELFQESDAVSMSLEVMTAQAQSIHNVLQRVAAHFDVPVEQFVLAGQGEFLVRKVLASRKRVVHVHSLTQILGSQISRAAPAHALATLAAEMTLT